MNVLTSSGWRDLHSSGLLCGAEQQPDANVLGHPAGPIFIGQIIHEETTLSGGWVVTSSLFPWFHDLCLVYLHLTNNLLCDLLLIPSSPQHLLPTVPDRLPFLALFSPWVQGYLLPLTTYPDFFMPDAYSTATQYAWHIYYLVGFVPFCQEPSTTLTSPHIITHPPDTWHSSWFDLRTWNKCHVPKCRHQTTVQRRTTAQKKEEA